MTPKTPREEALISALQALVKGLEEAVSLIAAMTDEMLHLHRNSNEPIPLTLLQERDKFDASIKRVFAKLHELEDALQ